MGVQLEQWSNSDKFFSTWNNGAEHLGQFRGGGGGGNGDVKEDFQDEEHLDILLPLLLSLLGRVDVDGEANGGLHSSSGRGAVLGAPERQVRGAAGPARHHRQPGLEQPRPQRHTGRAQQSKAVTVIETLKLMMLFTLVSVLTVQPVKTFKENI